MYTCYFQIPRGDSNRCVFVFYLVNNTYYRVFKKVLFGTNPYKTTKIYKIPKEEITVFINTVVANVY